MDSFDDLAQIRRQVSKNSSIIRRQSLLIG